MTSSLAAVARLDCIKDLINAAKSSKYSFLRKISADTQDVFDVWDAISQLVEFNMQREKAVNIPGLGCFTFTSKKMDIGQNKFIVVQRPVFVLSEKLVSIHQLSQAKHHIPGDFDFLLGLQMAFFKVAPFHASCEIPVVQLNYAALSHDLNIHRDLAEASVKEVIQSLSRRIEGHQCCEFAFTTIGNLVIQNRAAKMKFLPSFLESVDKTGNILEYMANRPNTCDSVLPLASDRSLVLPKIESIDALELVSSDSTGPLVKKEKTGTEQGNKKQAPTVLSPSSPKQNEKPAEPLKQEIGTASIVGPDYQPASSNACTPRKNIQGRCGGVVFKDPRLKETSTPREPERNLASCNKDSSKVDMRDGEAAVGNAHGTRERLTRSLELDPRGEVKGNLSPPRVKTRRISLPAEQEAKPKRTPKSDAECLKHKCDNCAARNSDFCYLCFQREKRNVPMYFAEERKLKEAEEDRLLQMYQHLKDGESLLREQENNAKRREDAQSTAAFNLGVAEAIKSKENERPTLFHRSFIFRKRPVTPPQLINKVEEDLARQVQEKSQRLMKAKRNQDCLERLEQMQLAEDLAAQRKHYLQSKRLQSEEYRKALDTQVYIRKCLQRRDEESSTTSKAYCIPQANVILPFQKDLRLNSASSRMIMNRALQLPASEPDSDGPIFGIHDSTPEKLDRSRRCARKLYEAQVEMALEKQTKRQQFEWRKRKEEEEMLNRTRKELIEETYQRNNLNYITRKNLEESWARNASMKRGRELKEKVQALDPGILLLEQADKYGRCDQCYRQPNNCGESNVWSESRYVSGSRLMV